jgi:hypothetical protein
VLEEFPDAYTMDNSTNKTIFEKGDGSECENHKGISLMNVGYKVFTRKINKRLRNISECLLSEEQSGFSTD